MSTEPVSRARLFPALALLAVLVASVLVAEGADAAFPGENGKIAFSRVGEIFVMNPDGTQVTNLSNNTSNDRAPSWSPDGTRMVFISDRAGDDEIFVMNADGTNQFQLTTTGARGSPSYSPNGTQIVYEGVSATGTSEIFIMNADGTNQTRLTETPLGYATFNPAWSPDGARIAFNSNKPAGDGTTDMEIYFINPDGSDETQLTDNTVPDQNPEWSPDGTKLAIDGIIVLDADGSNRVQLGPGGSPAWSPDGTQITFLRRFPTSLSRNDLFVMNADGSNAVNLTTSPDDEGAPSWQPLPDGPLPTTTSTSPPPTSTTSTTLVGDITAVTGDAYGYLAIVALLGGPPMTRPCDPPPAPPNTNCGPSPAVSLPATGGVATDTDPTGLAQIGPAVFLESGPITVNASGTTGPTGSVTASTSLVDVGPGPLIAEEMSSTCMASADSVSGSTTVVGGQVVTETDSEGNPTETVPIPVNPEPNTAIEGTINSVGDNFRIVFNEQVVTQTSITVYAAHVYLLGPNAIGDLWIGKSECSVTGSGTGPTTTTSSSIPPTTTTSSTVPPTSTSTTQPPTTTTTTSTTSTSTTSTTLPATTTTSTTLPPTTTTSQPPTTTTTSSTSTTQPPTTTTSTTIPPDGELVVTIDDTVLTDGSRGQVTGTIACEAGTLFALELDLNQGAANAVGTARGSCTGTPQTYTVGFATAGASFSDGPAQACVAARTGQAGSRAILDSTEICEEVNLDVRSRPLGGS